MSSFTSYLSVKCHDVINIFLWPHLLLFIETDDVPSQILAICHSVSRYQFPLFSLEAKHYP